MKYIKALKRKKIIEICLWVLFVVVTFYLWDFDGRFETAAYYTNNSLIEVLDDPTYSTILYSLNDEMADNYLPDYHLTLVNNTYREEKYNVYLALSKNVEQSHIKIKNDNINYLSNLFAYEDDEYYYYLLDSNVLQGSEKKYNFSLYNDINGNNFEPYQLKIELEKI